MTEDVMNDTSKKDIEATVYSEKKKRVRWGFIWALICALFWGIGYVPLQLVWGIDPMSTNFGIDSSRGYITTSLMISASQGIVFMIMLTLVWSGVTGKLKEWKRVITNRKAVKYLFTGMLFGGPCAIMGSSLAIGYIGADFAAATALLSTVVGALVGRVINKEKLSPKAIAGILVMVIGGIVILDPISTIDNITNPSSTDGVWLGYVGAILSILGWGLEGNIAVRALDVNDSDACLPVRFTLEGLFWLLVLLPITACIIGFDTFIDVFTKTFTSAPFLFWMVVCSLSLGFCYAAQYKAFALVGVGRTLSLSSLYVPISLVALAVFMGSDISLWIVAESILAVIGVFVMYWESSSLVDSTRDTGGSSDE